jgi:CRP-like cAMP-binding protein
MNRIHFPSLVGGRHFPQTELPEPTLAPFLNRLLKRSHLTRAEQQALLELPFQVTHVGRDRDFVCQGERPDHVSCVTSGLVARFDQTAIGKRQITALYVPGDVPDLVTVVQPSGGSALQALCPTTILQVPRGALRRLASAHPGIAEAFWRDCAVDSLITAQWVTNVGRRDAQSRIAHLLCEMAYRLEAPNERGAVTFRLPMTQSQLADATGMTPVHVNRSLMSLAQIGLTFRSGRVTIDNWNALVQTAGFDVAYLQVAEAEPSCAILRPRPDASPANQTITSVSLQSP